MKNFWFVLVALTALCLAPLGATAQEGASSKDQEYLALVAQMRQGKEPIDWAAVRNLYVQTSFYEPYGGAQSIWYSLQRAGQQLQSDPTPSNVAAYKTLLDMHFAHYRSHLQAIDFAKKTKSEHVNLDFEMSAFKGIINLITGTGDGKTPETAFAIIDPAEEHLILKAFRYELKGQDFRQKDGHFWDVLQYHNPMTKANGEMFFNVDTILRVAPVKK